jgi:tRNA(Ile)-lysidine synthase
MALPDRVLRTIRQHALVARGGRVLVALSGGPDSVALLHLLMELERAGELAVAGAAHVNHQLRGADADADEAFCRQLAAGLALPLEVGRADVRALARDEGRSIEDAARRARYAFLDAAADRLSAEVIAVGHSLDDQAETFLLRLVRGAGPRGLAGIRPRAGRVVRPLLDIRRSELRAYASERGLTFREDATNADVSVPRNRVRHELIPYLETHLSTGIVEVLAREAAIARQDEEHFHRQAIDLAGSVVLRDGPQGCAFRLQPDVPAALASRVARMALESVPGAGFIGYEQIERFLEFARHGRPGASLSLPGITVTHRGDMLALAPAGARSRQAAATNSFRYPLSIPGEVILGSQGWAISAALLENGVCPPSEKGVCPPFVAAVAGDLEQPLAVRSRRDGDRFHPQGLGGRGKKLQDFFVDRKIPRESRDLVPLVVDGADRIVWVVGQSVDEGFRVTGPSRGVILLKARQLGGPG